MVLIVLIKIEAKIEIMPNKHSPLLGAIWMITAGVAFALINSLTQWLSFKLHFVSTNIAFYQYTLALFFMLPTIYKNNWHKTCNTQHFKAHCLRVSFAVIGVQLWIWALAYPIPIWQAIALVMTSPLFATIGASLFLKEQIGTARILATVAGFIGAMLILQPWGNDFSWGCLLPIGAAFFWAAYSLMVKKLSSTDSPTTMVFYLFILMSPFNFILALPNWSFPTDINIIIILVVAGALTAFAQFAIAKAYSIADASFIQTFDHVKLPLNVLFGYLIFNATPPGRLWIGASIIIASISFITKWEINTKRDYR